MAKSPNVKARFIGAMVSASMRALVRGRLRCSPRAGHCYGSKNKFNCTPARRATWAVAGTAPALEAFSEPPPGIVVRTD